MRLCIQQLYIAKREVEKAHESLLKVSRLILNGNFASKLVALFTIMQHIKVISSDYIIS